MSETTTIFSVLKENEISTFCPAHPNASLMEVRQGPHKGKRGCDACLFDLVGPIFWNKRWAIAYETGEVEDARAIKYEVFEKRGHHYFYGDSTDTVIVSNKTGNIVGHLRAYDNPSVVFDWNPKTSGLASIPPRLWKKTRPAGYRKCRNQEQVLDWAIDAWSEW